MTCDLCDFKTSLVYKASFKTARVVTETPCLEKKTIRKKENLIEV